ncbi:MAG TPA: hypothetical protein VKA14_03210 [Gammaproteobacteria bacterium]|nr:hypothetical protein [Gammaproteobacteria bacterium]
MSAGPDDPFAPEPPGAEPRGGYLVDEHGVPVLNEVVTPDQPPSGGREAVRVLSLAPAELARLVDEVTERVQARLDRTLEAVVQEQLQAAVHRSVEDAAQRLGEQIREEVAAALPRVVMESLRGRPPR